MPLKINHVAHATWVGPRKIIRNAGLDSARFERKGQVGGPGPPSCQAADQALTAAGVGCQSGDQSSDNRRVLLSDPLGKPGQIWTVSAAGHAVRPPGCSPGLTRPDWWVS